MKAFEFRLQRIMDLRRQQADAARAGLQAVLAALAEIESEMSALARNCEAARTEIRKPEAIGEDMMAFSRFQDHTARRFQDCMQRKTQLTAQMEERRVAVVELERKVKLLERLRERGYAEWTVASGKELDELAADSHMTKLSTARTSVRLTTR